MKLSIVMPCYIKTEEQLELTRNAIFSIKQSNLPAETELILIDDNSPLGAGYLREQADIYIRHSKGKGFSGAANSGLKVARGEFILCTNNDIRCASNFWEVSDKIFEDKEVFSVHPRMLLYDQPMELGNKTFKQGKERWCQSSFFLMRNEGYLFPEWGDLGGSYEDWFFWAAAREDGKKTAYTTETCFQHKDSSTTNDPSSIASREKTKGTNKQRFIDRFGSSPEEYYNNLFADQMKEDWRGFFNEF